MLLHGSNGADWKLKVGVPEVNVVDVKCRMQALDVRWKMERVRLGQVQVA